MKKEIYAIEELHMLVAFGEEPSEINIAETISNRLEDFQNKRWPNLPVWLEKRLLEIEMLVAITNESNPDRRPLFSSFSENEILRAEESYYGRF